MAAPAPYPASTSLARRFPPAFYLRLLATLGSLAAGLAGVGWCRWHSYISSFGVAPAQVGFDLLHDAFRQFPLEAVPFLILFLYGTCFKNTSRPAVHALAETHPRLARAAGLLTLVLMIGLCHALLPLQRPAGWPEYLGLGVILTGFTVGVLYGMPSSLPAHEKRGYGIPLLLLYMTLFFGFACYFGHRRGACQGAAFIFDGSHDTPEFANNARIFPAPGAAIDIPATGARFVHRGTRSHLFVEFHPGGDYGSHRTLLYPNKSISHLQHRLGGILPGSGADR